jgi:hypothetical protein
MFNHHEGKSMEKTHEHSHEELFSSEWKKSQDNPFVQQLKTQEFSDLIKDRQDYREAFLSQGEQLDSLCCSDGRVEFREPEENGQEYDELKTPGQCILYSDAELDKFVSDSKGKIKRIASHDGCGAAAVKYNQMLADGLPLPEGVTNSDELGIYFTKNLAERLGAEYRHITQAELCCPIHNERALVLDSTTRFKPKSLKDFPPHFTSASLALNANSAYVQADAEILSGIALGDHGFNQRFDANNPFYIIIIAPDQAELDSTKELLSDFVAKSAGRVKITGALAPEL